LLITEKFDFTVVETRLLARDVVKAMMKVGLSTAKPNKINHVGFHCINLAFATASEGERYVDYG
jgi:hypothetical protein